MAKVSKRSWKHNDEIKTTWVCRYVDGTGTRRQETFRMKKDADAFKTKIEHELSTGMHVADAQSVTIADAVRDWLDACEQRAQVNDHMTFGTLKMYETCTKRIVAAFGAKLVKDVGVEDIQRMVDELAARRTPVTVKHTTMAAGLLFAHCISRGWTRRNPLKDHRIRMPHRQRTTEIPSKAEVMTLLRAAAERAPHEKSHSQLVRYAAVTIAVCLGLRRGELCGLRWEHVDFARNIIRVRHSLSKYDGLKSPKSKAGSRDVPLVKPVREALDALVTAGHRDPDGFVLTTGNGGPVAPNDMTNAMWRPLCKKAGLTHPNGRPLFRFHSLRHVTASLFIEHGLSALHVKTLIGHASVKTTLDIYGHLFKEDQAITLAATAIADSLHAARAPQQLLTP